MDLVENCKNLIVTQQSPWREYISLRIMIDYIIQVTSKEKHQPRASWFPLWNSGKLHFSARLRLAEFFLATFACKTSSGAVISIAVQFISSSFDREDFVIAMPSSDCTISIWLSSCDFWADHPLRRFLLRVRVSEPACPADLFREKIRERYDERGPSELSGSVSLKSKPMIGVEAVIIDKPHSTTVQTTIRALS